MYKSILSAEAKQDVKEIAEWYNTAQDNVGKYFTQDVAKTIALIRKNPHAFAERKYQTRAALTSKFPYRVYYYIDNDKKVVIITAVFHTSRDTSQLD